MTLLADLSERELRGQLAQGLTLSLHPFAVRLECPIDAVVRPLQLLYGQRELLDDSRFADFHLRVAPSGGLRRLVRRQVNFHFDGMPAFKPLPMGQALPMLEWGLNWCISSHAHQFLILHAAVLERDGRAAILPAPPGSGKSTLCAGLVHRGWRLLSDELALLDPTSLELHALARPVNLKNRSIEVIRNFEPAARLTEPVADTIKGTVALMAPPPQSVARVKDPALPGWIVFPRYTPGQDAGFTPRSKAWAAWMLAEQSFNYNLHGRAGFDALARLVDRCTCLDFEYSQLEEAAVAFADLASGAMDDLPEAGPP